jgi:hypothetical protein
VPAGTDLDEAGRNVSVGGNPPTGRAIGCAEARSASFG